MSAASDGSGDIDLHSEVLSDELQSAQMDRQLSQASQSQFSTTPEDLVSDGPIAVSIEEGPAGTSSLEPRPSGVATNKLVPYVTNQPFTLEPTYFTRPNRYFGPESTWLSWTKEERRVAEALDQRRSQDLSIHLYNAYALKRKGEAVASQSKKRRKAKERANSADDDDDDASDMEQSSGFVPPRGWTLWPLPPDQVPRDTYTSISDDAAYAMAPDTRPSATLEDCLIATTTRLAREKWTSRKWEPKSMDENTKAQHDQGVDTAGGAATSSRFESDAAETLETDDSESGSEVFESQRWDLEQKPVSPKPATNADDRDETRSEADQRPTPIADDDLARVLLLPATRHILSKYDSLLMGLHHARQAYATTLSSSNRSLRATGDSEPEEIHDSSSSHISRRRKRKRKRSVSVRSTTSEGGDTSTNISSQGRRPRRLRPRLNPRDWSDVVGMAALTGWDPAIVQLASERCARLFGENMLFRTFFEGDAAKKEPPFFTEHKAVTGDESTVSDGELPQTRTTTR